MLDEYEQDDDDEEQDAERGGQQRHKEEPEETTRPRQTWLLTVWFARLSFIQHSMLFCLETALTQKLNMGLTFCSSSELAPENLTSPLEETEEFTNHFFFFFIKAYFYIFDQLFPDMTPPQMPHQ